jgi:hypothetical protein
MGLIGKSDLKIIIDEITKNINFQYDIFVVGSASSILGYGLQKITNDVDTYNNMNANIVDSWNKACKKFGYGLKLNKTQVFEPPEEFEDRFMKSDISTAKVKVYYMEKHDFAISKIARGLAKDFDDVLNVHLKSPLDVDQLIQIFFKEYLFTVAIGSLTDKIISLKQLIEELFGSDMLADKLSIIDRLADRK